jgi:hypothetical protein
LFGPNWRHPGNRAFHAFVKTLDNAVMFLNFKPVGAKTRFANNIVAALRAEGREFLVSHPSTGLWMVASLIQAREKVLHLLREAAATEREERRLMVETLETVFYNNDEQLPTDNNNDDDLMQMSVGDDGTGEEEEEDMGEPLAPPAFDDIDWMPLFAEVEDLEHALDDMDLKLDFAEVED